MKHGMYKRTNMFRMTLLFLVLLFTTVVCAQEVVAEVDLEYRKESKQYLHDGKPLKGCYKVKYFDDDFVWRYYVADFQKGLRGDTVRYYDAKSNSLFRVLVRVNDSETLHLEYFFGGAQLFEKYRTIGGKREGLYKEWYKNGVLCRTREYLGGLLNGESCYWDDRGRLEEVLNYKDNLQDGWSMSYTYKDQTNDASIDEMTRSLYNEGGSPLLAEDYTLEEGRMLLTNRTIFDRPNSGERYSAFKDRCDSTRIDSLEDFIEIRDYRQGKIMSVERYTYDWSPCEIFETYYPEGGIQSKRRYEYGEVVAECYYAPESESNVRQVVLTSAMCADLKPASRNSRYFGTYEVKKPLVIRNQRGAEIFSIREADRRCEYYGYDPKLKLHFAFSTTGKLYFDNCHFVCDDGAVLTVSADRAAVNGDVGTIVTQQKLFDDENILTIYKYVPEGEVGYFIPVYTHVLKNSPYVTGLFWLGDNTLLVEYKDGGVSLDFDPESLDPSLQDELY